MLSNAFSMQMNLMMKHPMFPSNKMFTLEHYALHLLKRYNSLPTTDAPSSPLIFMKKWYNISNSVLSFMILKQSWIATILMKGVSGLNSKHAALLITQMNGAEMLVKIHNWSGHIKRGWG